MPSYKHLGPPSKVCGILFTEDTGKVRPHLGAISGLYDYPKALM